MMICQSFAPTEEPVANLQTAATQRVVDGNTWSTLTSGGPLPWYQAYNTTKHDRLVEFQEATLEHLLDACCGVLVILSAQFETNDFSPGNTLLSLDGPGDGMESGIGGYFRVRFPDDWPQELRYEFDWQELKQELDPFQTIDYSEIL